MECKGGGFQLSACALLRPSVPGERMQEQRGSTRSFDSATEHLWQAQDERNCRDQDELIVLSVA